MSPTTDTPDHLEGQLAEIESLLREARQDIAQILRCVQDELDAFREREFWRDHAQFYRNE